MGTIVQLIPRMTKSKWKTDYEGKEKGKKWVKELRTTSAEYKSMPKNYKKKLKAAGQDPDNP